MSNAIDLEVAISDAEGDALLLGLAIEDALSPKNQAWRTMGVPPMVGYDLFLLTADQTKAIWHAKSNALYSAQCAAKAYFGDDYNASISQDGEVGP